MNARNKLDYLYLTRRSSIIKCFHARPKPTQLKHLSCAPLQLHCCNYPELKRPVGDKHSSLALTFINYNLKKFIRIDT